nr:hypothetical protein [Bacillus subtilis]WEZ19226.1 hypothetical protein P5661_17875 [Bacillus subtilis]
MTETLKGQMSKEELQKRQQQEEKLKGFSPLQEETTLLAFDNG